MSTLGLQLMLHHVSTRHCSLLARLRQVVRAHVTSRNSARFSTWPACQWYPERSFTSDVKQEIYISSPRPPVTIPDKPFAEFMLSTIKQYGDLTALIDFPSGRSYTYTQLHDVTIKLASALYKLGYRKGDRQILFTSNCPEFAIMSMACAAIGVIPSTCNPAYNSAELARQMEHSGSTSVFCLPELTGTVREAIASNERLTKTVKEIIVIGTSEGCRPFFPLLEDDGKSFPENVDIDPLNDVFMLPYSSGTTGLPKGVMLTHRNVTANIKQICPVLHMEAGKDRMLVILPMYHIYGMVASMYVGLVQGITLVTIPRFVPQQFMNALEKHKITQLQLVPPLVVFLAKNPDVRPSDLSGVTRILSGAAPLGKEVTIELEKKCNVQIFQAFGMTETGPATHMDTIPAKHGTIGQLLPNTDGMITDLTTGESLGPNETGELCVRGPQVMKGYLDNEEATKHTVRNNWMYTGDIACYDDEGFFTVTDRLKELIKYKGFQVPPAELEALLLTHPDIQDCAVVGVPDEEAGELPRAYVVCRSGQHIDTDDVAKFVEKNVVSYKRLRGGVYLTDAIPKTASGKILRRELRDSAIK